MALLDKIFKPKWQHKDPAVRKTAVETLTDESLLATIAESDSDSSVRETALAAIRSEQILIRFISSSDNSLRNQARRQRLAQLLPGNNPAEALQQVSASDDLVSIANLTEDDDIRIAAIEKISDDQQRYDIAVTNPVARVRLVAAQGITSSDRLQVLLSVAQGKDKALYRFCKERLGELKAQEDAARDLKDRISNLIRNAAQLATAAYSPEYNGKVRLLEQQWQGLGDQIPAEDKAAFEKSFNECQSILDAHAAEEKAAEEKQAAILKAREDAKAILEQLENLEVSDSLNAALKDIEQRWTQIQQTEKSPAALIRSYEQALQSWMGVDSTRTRIAEQQEALQKLADKANNSEKSSLSDNIGLHRDISNELKQLPWPDALERPALLTELKNAAEKLNDRNDQLRSNENETSKQLKKYLTELETAIQEGHLKTANKLHGQANATLKKLGRINARKFQHQFQSLTAQLHEIRDWQGFAALPKKEALCDQMEALISSEKTPDVVAEKIRELQQEWKTLGPLSPTQDKALWDRFSSAADKAYEPCRAYFADVADQRKENLERREALIAQLTEYEAVMDWGNADWGTVQKTLDAARESFRQYSPVDRAAHKGSQQAFRDISDKIYSHIKDEYDRNIAEKESLITQAESLAEQEDLPQAMETCKLLQNKWKNIGLTPRNADQKLWKAFRAACDAVFSRRDEERKQHKADIENTITQAEEIVAKAEAAAQQTDSENQKALQQAQSEFSELSLPKGPYSKMRKRLSDAEQAQQNLIHQARNEKKLRSWNTLADKLMAIAVRPQDATRAETLWNQEGDLPKVANTTSLETRWNNAENAQTSEADTLRDVCIALEVLAETESPAEDQQARMAYQVQRLAAGLGQAGSLKDQLNELLNQWAALQADENRQSRFNKSLLELAKKL